MKRAVVAATAAVMVALLAGCSAPAENDAGPSESASPLVAEAPAVDAGDAAYLAYVRENLPSDTVIPNATDEQLLEAGAEACERRAAGEESLTLSVIDGEEPNGAGTYDDSAIIVSGAGQFLCS